MPHDRAAVPTHQPAQIKVPDQLQQSIRSDAPTSGAPRQVQQGGEDRPTGGILHELKTERAHD